MTTLVGVTPAIRVTFNGANGARRWPVLAAIVIDDDRVVPETRLLQRGLDAQGPLFGATTGYARCAAIIQSRLALAGFRAAPQSLMFTRTGDIYSCLTTGTPLTADLAFTITLDTDQLETIQDIHTGQHIQLFTESGEWFIETRVLDATQPVNAKLATRYGIKPTVPVLFADGAVVFVQKGGRVLRDLVFSELQTSYSAEPMSLLAPHLLTDVVDVGYRSSRFTGEGNQLYMINADGTLVQLILLRDQQVVAMCGCETDGKFRAVIGDVLARVWLVVERPTRTGGSDLYLEKWDGTTTLDAATVYDRGGMTTSQIGGMDYLEGKTVWAWADGDLIGPLVVVAGVVKLPKPVRKATVGLHPTLRARLPKLRAKLQDEKPFRAPGRVYEIELALAGTGQIDIAVNGGAFRDIPLTFTADERVLDIGLVRPRDTTGISQTSASEEMELLIRAVTMIPGTGEYAYSTTVVTDIAGLDVGVPPIKLNMHNDTNSPDFLVSLGQAQAALPKLGRISLFVGWFGNDLRAGNCTIRPKVEDNDKITNEPWVVAGVGRTSAQLVSQVSGRPAFGGTPDDTSVINAIQAMKAEGLKVTLTPFLMMDIPAANGLPNPYGGTGQAVYPWRGRITCHPAPGVAGTVDLTAAAQTQINTFMGTAAVSDFTVSGSTVTYTGPNEWTYRRFVLANAALAKAAGGIDVYVIGSEMRGLTWVRSALGTYPMVEALRTLAADVKAMLGSGTKVIYSADWSEYNAHQTGVSGELYFHLDRLWSSPNIDAVGIDNYFPLADWRDGTTHLDYLSGITSIYDRTYLKSNIFGGEGYDWYYASDAARNSQTRTPITDGAYGKPWVWRPKDFRSWWQNPHFNRPAGVQSGTATEWVPQSKPIWFMELGSPATDKGANQPNVFYDPKSSESFFPYYSAGVRDDEMQRAFIEAVLAFFDPSQGSYDPLSNPVSSEYGGRMVDIESIYIYTWDARFYPAFPDLLYFWGDGTLWQYGHWLTGRVFIPSNVADDSLPVGLTADLPMRDRLITGNIRVQNLRGWSRHPYIEISQRKPAPIEVRAIRYEVAHHG